MSRSPVTQRLPKRRVTVMNHSELSTSSTLPAQLGRLGFVILVGALFAAAGCGQETTDDSDGRFVEYRDTTDNDPSPDSGTPDTETNDPSPDTGPEPDYAELTTSDVISLEWPGVGNTAEATFEVGNDGARPMMIGDVEIREEPTDELRELSQGDRWPSNQTIAGYSSRTFTVQYRPLNETADSGTILVDASGSGVDDVPREIDINIEEP